MTSSFPSRGGSISMNSGSGAPKSVRSASVGGAGPEGAYNEEEGVVDLGTVDDRVFDEASDQSMSLESGAVDPFGPDAPQPVPALEVRDEIDLAGPPGPRPDPYTEMPPEPAASHLDELRAATGEEPTAGAERGGLGLESGSEDGQEALGDAGAPEQQQQQPAGAEAAGPMPQQKLLFDAALDSARAVRQAVQDPEGTNFGTGQSGAAEKVPLVWTLQPDNGGACLPGYFLDGRLCRRCAQGHVRGGSETECRICPPGTFADMTRQECRKCARGNYAYCECAAGTEGRGWGSGGGYRVAMAAASAGGTRVAMAAASEVC
jgi:hypothetical protein